jgi:two-component system sensor histidine kinase KdpD
MGSFAAGLVAGCLLGVGGTFLLLSIGVAFSVDGTRMFRVRSLPGTLLSTIALLCIAAFCHRLGIGKDASMLLLLLAVLGVSRLEGLVNGLIATAIAALTLGFWFLPPVGSMTITSSSDRLALALFLLIATLGSRLIGRRESSAS